MGMTKCVLMAREKKTILFARSCQFVEFIVRKFINSALHYSWNGICCLNSIRNDCLHFETNIDARYHLVIDFKIECHFAKKMPLNKQRFSSLGIADRKHKNQHEHAQTQIYWGNHSINQKIFDRFFFVSFVRCHINRLHVEPNQKKQHRREPNHKLNNKYHAHVILNFWEHRENVSFSSTRKLNRKLSTDLWIRFVVVSPFFCALNCVKRYCQWLLTGKTV